MTRFEPLLRCEKTAKAGVPCTPGQKWTIFSFANRQQEMLFLQKYSQLQQNQ